MIVAATAVGAQGDSLFPGRRMLKKPSVLFLGLLFCVASVATAQDTAAPTDHQRELCAHSLP